jgi:hypothetical protein
LADRRRLGIYLPSQDRLLGHCCGWYSGHLCELVERATIAFNDAVSEQGDLEAESFVKAEIIASHLDEGPRMEVPARLFEGPEVLFRRIPAGAVAEHIKAHGTLKIERRWVESDLPHFELLDALATA